MSLLEFNLDNPAYKRIVEPEPDDEPVPEAEADDDPAVDESSSGRRPRMGVAVLLVALVTALVIKRRRS